MEEDWAALLGAVIGGLLSFAGTVGVARYQARREEERLERDRRRENLSALQDAIDPVFRQYFAALEARWLRHEDGLIPSPDLASAVFRINMQSLRVGDDVLAGHLSAILEALAKARSAEGQGETFRAYNEAHELVDPARQRIGKLLHTDARVDLSI